MDKARGLGSPSVLFLLTMRECVEGKERLNSPLTVKIPCLGNLLG